MTVKDLVEEYLRLRKDDPIAAESFCNAHKDNEKFMTIVRFRAEMVHGLTLFFEDVIANARMSGSMEKAHPCDPHRHRSHRRRRYCHGR